MQAANLNGRDCPEPRGVVSAQNETDFPAKFSDAPPPDAARHNAAESLHLYEHKVNIFTAGT